MDIKFNFDKETANTIRFKEVVEVPEGQKAEDVKPIVGTLYLRKDIAGDRKEVTITVNL